MQTINLLVTDSHGVYLPMAFVEGYDLSLWNGVDEDAVHTIMGGPDQEHYWDAWNDLLSSATYSHDGHTYHLYQDGDLFAIDYDGMTDEEYKDFFGEERVR